MQLELRQLRPPYRPPLDGADDVQNFDTCFTEEMDPTITPTDDEYE